MLFDIGITTRRGVAMAIVKPKKGNVIFNIGERWIWLLGYISEDTATQFAKFLIKTQQNISSDWTNSILVIINSNGGDLVSAHLIYRMLANFPSPVTTLVDKKAISGAFAIFQAGSKRILAADAKLQFHRASYHLLKKNEIYKIGNLNLMRGRISRINNRLYQIFAQRSKIPMEKIKKFFCGKKILTASQAKKYNLTDEILGSQKRKRSQHKNLGK